MSKKTVIIGASSNPSRYSFIAVERLLSFDHKVVPLGIKKGTIFNTPILNLKEKPGISNVDTVTLYLNPNNQKEWEDYILSLNPRRIIFNPGTENQNFSKRATQLGIETMNACTLVMLSIGNY